LRIVKFLLALFAVTFSVSVLAQQGQPGPGGPGGGPGGSRLDAINQAVTLTADQRAKVEVILQHTTEEMAAAQKRNKDTWNDSVKAEMDKLLASEKAAILEVLDASQKPKYEAYFNAWKEERNKDKHS